MFSQKEKDRRVTAAGKRLEEAETRVKVTEEKLAASRAVWEAESRNLAWLLDAPVSDPDPDPEPTLFE